MSPTNIPPHLSLIETSGFVLDPVGEHKKCLEQLNAWTDYEKDVFKEKFMERPKDFQYISDALERKNVQNCILYYYARKKQDNFSKPHGRRYPVRGRRRRPGPGSGVKPIPAAESIPRKRGVNIPLGLQPSSSYPSLAPDKCDNTTFLEDWTSKEKKEFQRSFFSSPFDWKEISQQVSSRNEYECKRYYDLTKPQLVELKKRQEQEKRKLSPDAGEKKLKEKEHEVISIKSDDSDQTLSVDNQERAAKRANAEDETNQPNKKHATSADQENTDAGPRCIRDLIHTAIERNLNSPKDGEEISIKIEKPVFTDSSSIKSSKPPTSFGSIMQGTVNSFASLTSDQLPNKISTMGSISHGTPIAVGSATSQLPKSIPQRPIMVPQVPSAASSQQMRATTSSNHQPTSFFRPIVAPALRKPTIVPTGQKVMCNSILVPTKEGLVLLPPNIAAQHAKTMAAQANAKGQSTTADQLTNEWQKLTAMAFSQGMTNAAELPTSASATKTDQHKVFDQASNLKSEPQTVAKPTFFLSNAKPTAPNIIKLNAPNVVDQRRFMVPTQFGLAGQNSTSGAAATTIPGVRNLTAGNLIDRIITRQITIPSSKDENQKQKTTFTNTPSTSSFQQQQQSSRPPTISLLPQTNMTIPTSIVQNGTSQMILAGMSNQQQTSRGNLPSSTNSSNITLGEHIEQLIAKDIYNPSGSVVSVNPNSQPANVVDWKRFGMGFTGSVVPSGFMVQPLPNSNAQYSVSNLNPAMANQAPAAASASSPLPQPDYEPISPPEDPSRSSPQ